MKVKEVAEMIFSGGRTEERTRRCKMFKKMLLMALVITLMGTGLVLAWENSDTFTITFTPLGDRGVIIGTEAVTFTNLVPGTSTTTLAIPTESTGTIGNIEYTIAGAMTSGVAVLSDDLALTEGEVLLQALFTNNAIGGESWALKDVVEAVKDVGDATGACEGTDDLMDDMTLNTKVNLYCKLTLPASVSYTGAQEITVTVTAEEGGD